MAKLNVKEFRSRKSMKRTTKESGFVKTLQRFSVLFLVFIALFLSTVSTLKAQSSSHLEAMHIVFKALDIDDRYPADISNNVRNTAISYLVNRTRYGVEYYQGLDNQQLLDSLMYEFYLRLNGIKGTDIKTMSFDDMRNTTIVIINKKRPDIAVSTLQGIGSGYELVKRDGIDDTGIQNKFFRLASESKFKFNPTTQDCANYDAAVTRDPQLAADLNSKRRSYNEIIGKIDSILRIAKKVFFIPGSYNAYLKTNPTLQAFEQEKASKLAEIKAAEQRLIDNQYILKDSLQRCTSCRDQKSEIERGNQVLTQYGSFVDFFQDFREQMNSMDATFKASASNSPGDALWYDSYRKVTAETFDNMTGEPWEYSRYAWLHRNDPPLAECR